MIPLAAQVAGFALSARHRPTLRARLGAHGLAVEAGAVWVHAASVGEVRAAEVLWDALPAPRLLTVDTPEGLAVARGFAGAAAGVLPADHRWTLSPLFSEARPRAVVFVEGTWWPALAALARAAGVPVVRVSAKMGQGTGRVPTPLLRWFWRDASLVVARDAEEAERLAPAHRCAVRVGEDLKRFVRPPASPLRWPGPFVAGASLRGDDDRHLLGAVPAGHRVLLAPRHPGRYDPARLSGHRWMRRTELVDGRVPSDIDVVWLDTLGELGACLQGAAAAFVGGTFDPRIGGHSPREAQAWGVPVVAGPATASAPSAFADVTLVERPAGLADALEAAVAEGRRAPPMAVGPRETLALLDEVVAGPSAEVPPRPWARPLQPAYRWGQRLHDRWRRWRPERVAVPVISVGSTNARSPGRTSSVRWVVGELQRRGARVGVAVRGYRRARRGRDLRLSCHSADAADLGDEGALLARCGALVAAGPDRVAGVRALVRHGCDVVVLDDGLQARQVARDVDLVVVDARFPTARGLLPAGDGREEQAVPERADVVWVHHGSGRFAAAGERVERRLGPWRRGRRDTPPPAEAVWFCAVGHPAQVLSGYDGRVLDLWLAPDHHRPEPDALRRFVGKRALLTTEKDAERLPADLREVAWTRPLVLEVPEVPWLEALWP